MESQEESACLLPKRETSSSSVDTILEKGSLGAGPSTTPACDSTLAPRTPVLSSSGTAVAAELQERAERAEAQLFSLRRQLERSQQAERILQKENATLVQEVSQLRVELRDMEEDQRERTKKLAWLNVDAAEQYSAAKEAAIDVLTRVRADQKQVESFFNVRQAGAEGWTNEILNQIEREKTPFVQHADLEPARRRPAWLDEDSVMAYGEEA